MNASEMPAVHLGVVTDWEYDRDFIGILEQTAHQKGLETRVVSSENLKEVIRDVENGILQMAVLLDRASDTSPEFIPLQSLCKERGWDVIEPIGKMQWAADKATMHLEFLQGGIHTPFTVILPPYKEHADPAVSLDALSRIGSPFVFKPAIVTGGGQGVHKSVTCWRTLTEFRKTVPDEKILIQERVVPMVRDGRRFWFRCFFCFGQAMPVWWDDTTHLYDVITQEQAQAYGLEPLNRMAEQIASICALRFFSTEIAFPEPGHAVAIDYVNEVCDMRPQSLHHDGIPDPVVTWAAERITGHVQERIKDFGLQ